MIIYGSGSHLSAPQRITMTYNQKFNYMHMIRTDLGHPVRYIIVLAAEDHSKITLKILTTFITPLVESRCCLKWALAELRLGAVPRQRY